MINLKVLLGTNNNCKIYDIVKFLNKINVYLKLNDTKTRLVRSSSEFNPGSTTQSENPKFATTKTSIYWQSYITLYYK